MVDHSVHAACETADQLVAVGRLLHSHAGKLAQKSPGIAFQHIFFFHNDLSAKSCTGKVKRHIGAALSQYLFDAVVGPGTDDPDIQSSVFYRKLLFFLFRLQISGEFLPAEYLSGKLLVFPDHIPDPLVVQTDSRFFGDPWRVQHVNELIGKFSLKHIVQTADAVAAGCKDDTLILSAHHFFQHAFGKTADIGMHPDLRLIEIRHIRFDPFHFCTHGLENFHRRVFTYIS